MPSRLPHSDEQVAENVPQPACTGCKVALAFLLINKCSFPVSLRTCVRFIIPFLGADAYFPRTTGVVVLQLSGNERIFVHFRSGQEYVFVI